MFILFLLFLKLGVKNPPPPDPAYNFLKDPLRGDNCAHSSNEKRVGNKERNSKSETKVENKETDHDQKHSAKAVSTITKLFLLDLSNIVLTVNINWGFGVLKLKRFHA